MGRGLALGLATLAGCGALLLVLRAALGGTSLRSRRRRLQVISPKFSLQKPVGGNLPNVASNSGNIDVVAGPTYASFTIDADGGLGSSGDVRVKLVNGDTTNCSSAQAQGAAPLDGSAAPSIRTASLNTFSGVRFAGPGVFKICYKSASLIAYELLPVTITVMGGVSSNEHFCAATAGTQCILKISGSGLGSLYKIGLIPYAADAACGSSSIDVISFSNSVSQLITSGSTSSVQLHNFSTKKSLAAATYLLCLCPGFDADAVGGACSGGSAADFSQSLGRLFVTTASANVARIYSGLSVDLIVNCGAGVGGCTSGSGSRYKITDHSTSNDLPAWNSSTGCGSNLQTFNQIRPSNCESSVMCQHSPDSESALAPTWHSLALRSSSENQRYMTTILDVCYCDNDCLTTKRWFKVGELRILPITVAGPAVVNILSNLELKGLSGSWTASGNKEQREMKLLPDSYGSVSDTQCFEVEQSRQLVDGHECASTIDCEPPTSGDLGQTYIGVGVKAPGWVAVCYCDTRCRERGYWMVQGHLLVAGPIAGQSWSFYTSVTFDLDIKGWALKTANRILIIDKTLQCGSLGVSQHSTITGPEPISPQQSSGAAGSITAIERSGTMTKITFASKHGLKVGDSLSIAGATCGSCAPEDRAKFNAHHEVKRVLSSNELLVALAFPSGSYPIVVTTGATFHRDDLQTFQGLRALVSGEFQVCWRASASDSQLVAATAGRLLISAAPVMPVGLSLSTIEPDKVAPIVITFTTSSNLRYRDAVDSMQVKVVFLNPSLLMPAFFNGSLASVDPRYDTLEEASQSACGLWISELGTGRKDNGEENTLGFPMPRGCYHKQAGQTWEFHIVFEPRNGLAPSSTYDIVMNAAIRNGLTKTDEVLHIDSFDDTIRKRFDVIESGRAAPNKAAASELRGSRDPEFHFADGVRITGSTANNVWELKGTKTSFQARLRAAVYKPIMAGNIVRLFARPLTQWVVGYSCFTSCIAYAGRTCGVPLCLTESVMDRWYHRNVLRVKLPKGMANITYIVMHTLNITSLPTPPGGFFPLRWGAELQSAPGKKPHYVTTSGNMLYIRPAAEVAAIVTRVGDGNMKPFQNQLANTLYVKLVLGATMFAVNSHDAFLRFVLPPGYSCANGSASPPAKLGLLSGLVPSTRGNLTNGSQALIWTALASSGQSPARCELYFGEKMVVFAGTSFFLTVSVNNPSTTLAQDADGNRWKLELAAKGEHSSVVTAPLIDFQGDGTDLSSSVSVLGTLKDSSIVPSDFALASTDNWLSIFFRTVQGIDPGGAVWVDGPSGFGVGTVCQVKDLPSYYYSAFDLALANLNYTNGTSPTLPLPYSTCTGVSLPTTYTITRAQIKLSARLLKGSSYGFMLRVTNPDSYHTYHRNGWRIYTRSPAGKAIDGSLNSVQLNAGNASEAGASWGMYDHHIGASGFEAYIADMRPSGMPTKIRVFPIIFWSGTNRHVRIIAPAGYAWNFSSSDFVHRAPSTGLAAGSFVPGVEADMPLSAPPVAPTAMPYNVLEFKNILGWFRWGVKYGFEAQIIVPQYTPTSSANVFILQAGYDDSTGGIAGSRSQAAVVEAQLVRRIMDAVVSYNTTVANESNTVVVKFRTLTEIPSNGGLVVHGPSGFTFSPNASCRLKVATGASQPLPSQVCQLGNFSGVGSTALASVLATKPIPAMAYELHLPVRNPPHAILHATSAGSWRLASYDSLSAAAPEPVDYEGRTPSFRPSSRLGDARIVSGKFCLEENVKNCLPEDQQYQKIGRNDRLGARNNLIFSVNLSAASAPGQFVIRAPIGFVWPAECNVVVASSFGAFNPLPANFSKWPSNVTAGSCRGHENVAVFNVAHPEGQGLIPGRSYAFRIDWVTNPLLPILPAENFWTLDFSGQASLPFKGFQLWTLSDLSLTPHTTAERFFNDVTLRFAALNTVPKSGYVDIVAPGGFVIPHRCLLTISTALPAKQWETEKLFLAGDYNCTGVLSGGLPTNRARFHLSKKSLFAGMQYIFRLSVMNPAVTSAIPGSWSVATFRKVPWVTAKASYEQLDTASLVGFPVNDRVGYFVLSNVPQVNGRAKVRWVFSLLFREAIFVTDRVEFRAPVEYSLQSSASSTQCAEYQVLLGLEASSNTTCSSPCYHQATCVNSTMVWDFRPCPSYRGPSPIRSGLCLQEDTYVQFALRTQNPGATPSSNWFFVKHASSDGDVRSSAAIPAYPIVPLLGDARAEPEPFGITKTIAEAVGSQSAIGITFVPTGAARTVTIEGGVAGESFRFTNCAPKDNATKESLFVDRLEPAIIVLSLRETMIIGKPMTILLENMGNPSQAGVSSWNVTTYKYYDAVLGPMIVVNQKIGIVGFEVLGFLSVLTTSTLRPRYYGKKGAVLALNFKSSLDVQQGDEVVIKGPRSYTFESNLFNVSGALLVANLRLMGPGSGPASNLSGSYAQVNNVTSFQAKYLSSGGRASDMLIYKHANSSSYLYLVPGGKQWAIGPTPGTPIVGTIGEVVLSSSLLVGQVGWQIRTNVTEEQAQGVYVSAEGVTSVASGGAGQLSLRVGKQLPAAETAVVRTTLSLPKEEQVERNWRLFVRRGADQKIYATNDMQFASDALLWEIRFEVVPSLTAPKASISVDLGFDQERSLPTGTKGVRFELTAPASYRFEPNCFPKDAERRFPQDRRELFGQCIGFSNVATMYADEKQLAWLQGRRDKLRVELKVQLPEETPLITAWTLNVFLSSQSVSFFAGSVPGFPIKAMPVSFKGSNQLSLAAPGYFTVIPLRDAEAGSTIRIRPPSGQRYEVSCWEVRKVNLPAQPDCRIDKAAGALVLTLKENKKAGRGKLEKNRNYTFGIGITNAGRTIPDPMNLWAVVIHDSKGNIQDSNYQILGERLQSMRISTKNDVQTDKLADGNYRATITLTFRKDVVAGVISELRIVPPEFFRISEGGWKVADAFTSAKGQNFTNGALVVPLPAATIPSGLHSIQVTGSISGDTQRDSTWLLQARRGEEVMYQHVLGGFTS